MIKYAIVFCLLFLVGGLSWGQWGDLRVQLLMEGDEDALMGASVVLRALDEEGKAGDFVAGAVAYWGDEARLESIREGRYMLEVSHVGIAKKSQRVAIKAGEEQHLEIRLTAGAWFGEGMASLSAYRRFYEKYCLCCSENELPPPCVLQALQDALFRKERVEVVGKRRRHLGRWLSLGAVPAMGAVYMLNRPDLDNFPTTRAEEVHD